MRSRTFAATKTRLKGANTGHKLLKKKSDALTVRIRQILKQVYMASSCGRASPAPWMLPAAACPAPRVQCSARIAVPALPVRRSIVHARAVRC